MYQFESTAPFCESSSSLDLQFFYCGTMECDSGRLRGPALWDHYRLNFIQSGSGDLTIGGRTWKLGPRQCFMISPNLLTSYRSDASGPWAYYWVAFSGINAQAYLRRAGLSPENPVIDVPEVPRVVDSFERMFAASKVPTSGDLRLLAELYQVLAALMDAAPVENRRESLRRNNLYVVKAVEWFSINYSRDVSIADMVRFIGLNPKYFARIFREETGLSPQKFLLNLRLNKARELLMNPDLSVGEVARSVGYDDQLLFSRMFRKHLGVSPVTYRKGEDV